MTRNIETRQTARHPADVRRPAEAVSRPRRVAHPSSESRIPKLDRSTHYTRRQKIAAAVIGGLSLIGITGLGVQRFGEMRSANTQPDIPTLEDFNSNPQKYGKDFTLHTVQPGEGADLLGSHYYPDKDVRVSSAAFIQEDAANDKAAHQQPEQFTAGEQVVVPIIDKK